MPDIQLPHIEASHKKIMEVFSSSYTFTIPVYQRPYAWETDEVEDLLTDLMDAQKNPDNFYFLGSIVLVKKDGDSNSQVVDGQQRLTTLTIIFSVIRDLTDDESKKTQREKYVKQTANKDEGLPETLRLQLRQKDQRFFAQYIQNLGATDRPPNNRQYTDSEACIIQNTET
ncbi:MAG: DUF262 domain-containing protein, partial [Gammaproteobacteria bacterium]|nr:DUF262 domain-containing protein [Gammaproteobacteria bacterium]